MEPAPGRLLVASPSLADPNFARTLVLVLGADDGYLGVVLNRPSTTEVGEVLGPWGQLVGDPAVLFQGGPVELDSAIGLAAVRTPEDPPVGWRRVFDRTGVLDLDTPTELLADGLTGVRIYAGYAGWGAGQLEAEIEEGAWNVVPARPEDLFAPDPDRLWRQVLRRQPGALKLMTTMPEDASWN
jgi:putative transcriptional regulator